MASSSGGAGKSLVRASLAIHQAPIGYSTTPGGLIKTFDFDFNPSELSLSRPTTSRHLGVLRKAGLVEETTSEDDARGREYRLRPQPFARVRSWLDEVEAFWGDQLGSFKAHVEKKHGAARPP